MRSFEGKIEGLPQRGSAWCAEDVGSRRVVAARVNTDFQPSATLRSGAGPQRHQMVVAVQRPNEVCVSFGVRIMAFNVCSAVEVDKKLGFERRRRSKARCLAITEKKSASPPRSTDTERLRKGAAPLRGRCDAGQETESRTISGGLTRSRRKLHVRRCNMQPAHYV